MPDIVPNYLTTSPTGEVGATFSGLMSASGIQLPYQPFEQGGGPGAGFSNEIQWLYPPDTGLADLVLARLTATRGGSGALSAWTYAPEFISGSKLLTQIRMRHYLLGVPAADRDLSQIEAIVQGAIDGVGTLSPVRIAKILDHNGNSDFRFKTPSNFQRPGFYNPWRNYGSGYALQGYRVWNDGMCHVQGMIAGGPAYGTQYITAYIPTPVDGALLVPAVGYVGATYGLVRLDVTGIDANGAALIFGDSVFPAGSVFGFIGYSFSYQSTQVR